MKINKWIVLVGFAAMLVTAGCSQEKENTAPAPAGTGPTGGNNPSSIPPPVGQAPGGGAPQGGTPPPAPR